MAGKEAMLGRVVDREAVGHHVIQGAPQRVAADEAELRDGHGLVRLQVALPVAATGFCRGHGGGKRCQTEGCTKLARSGAPHCNTHGGGKPDIPKAGATAGRGAEEQPQAEAAGAVPTRAAPVARTTESDREVMAAVMARLAATEAAEKEAREARKFKDVLDS